MWNAPGQRKSSPTEQKQSSLRAKSMPITKTVCSPCHQSSRTNWMDTPRGIIVNHRIVLTSPDVCPLYLEPYRSGPCTREFKRDKTEKLQKMHVFKPAETEWAARIVFAPTNYRALRLSVDYPSRNGGTVRDSFSNDGKLYRLPGRCRSIFDARCKLRILSNQIKRWRSYKMAVTPHHRLFRFIFMSFVLKTGLRRSSAL